MNREKAIDFLACRRAYYASLSTDPDPNIKATKVCGYTLAESANACLMAIEALKQEPCEDAVSRDEVKQILLHPHATNVSKWEQIKLLPSVQPTNEWIPISERLPEENGWYQCTVILNDLPRTMELFYKNGKWLDNRRIDMFDTCDIYGYGNTKVKHKLSYRELISEFDWTEKVIAWKPLSLPYKAESEVEDADSD